MTEFTITEIIQHTDISSLRDKLLSETKILNVTSIPIVTIKINGKTRKSQESEMLKQFHLSLVGYDKMVDLSIKNLKNNTLEATLSYHYDSSKKLKEAEYVSHILEKFNAILNKYDIRYITIHNSVSDYYLQRLFPKFQRYENGLRKLLVLAISPTTKGNFYDLYQEVFKPKLGSNTRLSGNDLGELGINELHQLIFEINPNSVNYYDDTYFEGVEDLTKEKILDLIDKGKVTTIWSKYFSKYIKNQSLSLENNYTRIKKYRNEVMHFHIIHSEQFKKMKDTIEQANSELSLIEEEIYNNWEITTMREFANDLSSGLGNLSMLSQQLTKNFQSFSPITKSALVKAAQSITTPLSQINEHPELSQQLYKSAISQITSKYLEQFSTRAYTNSISEILKLIANNSNRKSERDDLDGED